MKIHNVNIINLDKVDKGGGGLNAYPSKVDDFFLLFLRVLCLVVDSNLRMRPFDKPKPRESLLII